MKVLLLTPEYPPIGGGAANACFYLVKEMGKLGVEVDVLTSGTTQNIEKEAGPSGEVIRLPVGKKAIHYWTYPEAIRFTWQARRFIRKFSHLQTYSIHHAFFTIPSALVAFPWRKRHPYIVAIRGSDVPGFNNRFTAIHTILRPLTRILWSKAAAVVSNSQGLRDLAWKTMPTLDIEVIPNGIDTQEFYPAGAVGSEDSNRATPFRLLAVNRLIHRKGMDVLFQALAELRTEMGEVFDLEIVGEGNLQSELEDLSRRLGISGMVRFEGAISHENLPEVYRRADVFVLPSRAEGMSNALLEAMASGLPAISDSIYNI